MTTPLSKLSMPALIDRARQGDARAIARLLTQSLAGEGIVAQGHWQNTRLYLDLEAATPISQQQMVPHVRRGLGRLELTCPVEAVWVSGRRVDCATADWREGFALGTPSRGAETNPEVTEEPSDSNATDIADPGEPPGGAAGDETRPSELAASASPFFPQTDAPSSDRPDLRPPESGQPGPGRPESKGLTPEGPHEGDKTAALSDTTLIALTHLAPLVSYLVLGSQWLGGWPLFWGGSFLLPWRVVAPLVLLLVKGGAPEAISGFAFVQRQAKAALNFQLTMVIAWVVTLALMFILVGFLLVVPLALMEMVSCVVAAVQASEGKPARYVGAIRFVR